MSELESQSERVLVVDDHEAVTRTIARWLQKDGYACDVAHSVAEAEALVDRNGYGLVFADVHMPGGSGLELARVLKERDDAIQVVIVTGSTTLETAVEALRLNADDYLLKPFDPAGLRHSARRATEHRRLILENRDYRHNLEERVRAQAERLEKLYLSSVHSLVGALEAKDPHTRGHSDRVAEYALTLLERVGGVDPESMRIGAQLHDIGKIGIPGEVLRKEGPLNAIEIGHIRQHPTIGVQILSPMLEDRTALDIVRHHHERWDGAGYPDGVAGKQIPLAARIVAVADTFDAMTTSRPYRAALSAECAVAEIEREAGRQFDPAVARHAAEALGSLMGRERAMEKVS